MSEIVIKFSIVARMKNLQIFQNLKFCQISKKINEFIFLAVYSVSMGENENLKILFFLAQFFQF